MNILGVSLFTAVILILNWANYQVIKIITYWFQNESNEEANLNSMTVTGKIILFFIEVIYLLDIVNYLKAAFCDPGFLPPLEVPSKTIYPESLIKECKKCEVTIEGEQINIFKPPRAHHCKTCQRCVFRMDHHCEWINNCVGYKNQKYFILFLFYTFHFSILTFLTLLGNFIMVYTSIKHKVYLFLMLDFYRLMNIFLAVFSLFFIFMCVSFLKDQIEALQDNQTTVESHKNTQGIPQTMMFGVKQIFGTDRKTWLLPVQPKTFHINYLELMYSDQELVFQHENKLRCFLEDEFTNQVFEKYWIKKDPILIQEQINLKLKKQGQQNQSEDLLQQKLKSLEKISKQEQQQNKKNQ